MVYKKSLVEDFFEREFGWVPEDVVDALKSRANVV